MSNNGTLSLLVDPMDLDSSMEYNDEIVSIEECDETQQESMDITVSFNNLFYANGLLTKNSMGIAHTTDLMIAVITTDELAEQNQYMVKQLKNRYNDLNKYNRFCIGVNYAKMKIYDVEASAQANISGMGSGTPPGQQQQQQAPAKKSYSGFKFGP